MKYLVMCEGSNELEVVRILLANNRLIFGEDDLLGLTPYHARQIENNAQVRTELNMYPGNDVCVIRIGDKQSDKLRIPEEYKDKIVDEEWGSFYRGNYALFLSQKDAAQFSHDILWKKKMKLDSEITMLEELMK
jgi:hypothetical protein